MPQVMKMHWRLGVLFAVAATLVIGVALHGPIPQDPGYHNFADQRAIFGISHFFDVFSNAPFLIVGIAGLLSLRQHPRLCAAYAVFFCAAILIAFGSAIYHLRPDNRSLAFDRLQMTLAFMAFVAIVIGEHVDAELGRRALPLLVVMGIFSVIVWQATDDLRAYVLVQFLPSALIPLVLLLFPSIDSTGRYFWAALSLYAASKVFELLDHRVYAISGFVSGHTLKHLAAAAAASMLVLAIRQRQLVRSASAVLISGCA